MVDFEPSTALSIAIDIAREAGEILSQGYGHVEEVDYKGAIDLVTEFDRRSEDLILTRLQAVYPDHILVGEETSAGPVDMAAADDHPTWLVDPLDGTTNFAHGFPVFCVSLALWTGRRPILGVIYDPSRGECFSALEGGGAFLNNRRIAVSRTAELSRALLATGFPYDIRTSDYAGTNLGHFTNFAVRAQAIRRAGSAALDLAYVACGRFDGFWEMKLHPWDVAAGILLVSEAGGLVTDFEGRTAAPQTAGRIVASNGWLHQAMRDVLRLGL